ncbi:Uncharacterised protein [Serratia marcescens]|nr:Uncharacterised protein [Serratia marcescens]
MDFRLMMTGCILTCFVAFAGLGRAKAENALGGTYARLLMLSSTEDISASSFRTDEGVRFDKFLLPYEMLHLDITDRLSLSGTVRGGYLKVKGQNDDDGSIIRLQWDIFSVVSGLVGRYHINDEVAMKGGVELGYVYMRNRYAFDDENRLDMASQNGLIAPMLGIEYTNEVDNGDRLHIEGGLSWMHVSSFSTSNRLMNIHNEKAGSWSLRGEYTFDGVYRLLSRPMDVIVSNNLGGFYGKGYRDIDMGFMNNTELATGSRVRIFGRSYGVRVGVGYLVNDKGHGVSLVMRMN